MIHFTFHNWPCVTRKKHLEARTDWGLEDVGWFWPIFGLEIAMFVLSPWYHQWGFQDPKMEVLYQIRLYFVGIFPYIGLISGMFVQPPGWTRGNSNSTGDPRCPRPKAWWQTLRRRNETGAMGTRRTVGYILSSIWTSLKWDPNSEIQY